MGTVEVGQTFAPLWRVECQHPRCDWFAESVMRSTLEDEWEAHDEMAHVAGELMMPEQEPKHRLKEARVTLECDCGKKFHSLIMSVAVDAWTRHVWGEGGRD